MPTADSAFLSRLAVCLQRTFGKIDRTHEDPDWPAWNFCLVDLNYTASPDGAEEQTYYALQVTLPCNRIWEGSDDNETYTSLCYNHYHPEFFSSISETGKQYFWPLNFNASNASVTLNHLYRSQASPAPHLTALVLRHQLQVCYAVWHNRTKMTTKDEMLPVGGCSIFVDPWSQD